MQISFNHKRIFVPIVSFAITIIIYSIIFYNSSIFGSGNYTILRGDLFSQYTAFINEFLHSFGENKSFYYSFSNYLGSSNSLMFAYYAYNPFNLLYLISGISLSLCTAIIICFKLGLSSACFAIFLQFIDSVKDVKNNINTRLINLISSLCYSLSGFIVIFHYHIMWLDAFYMLPLICLFLYKFVFENKKIGLIILYVFLFISNFYMGYIVGIYSAFIFVCLSFYRYGINEMKEIFKKIFSFTILVFLSIGISAVLLLPAAIQLINQTGEDKQSFLSLKLNFLDVLNSMFVGHLPTINNEVPFLYCGIITVLLLPLFFINKKIRNKDKALSAVVIAFLLFSILVKPLYMLMHAFDKPNYYGFRFAFLAVFTLIFIGNFTLKNIDKIKLLYWIPFSGLLCWIYYYMIDNQKKRFSNIYFNDLKKLQINIIFIGIFTVLIWLYSKIKHKIYILGLIFISLLVELTINGNILFYQLGTSETEDKVNTYTCAINKGLDQIKSIEDESNLDIEDYDFYRIRIDNDINFNTAGQFNFNSLTSFSSSDAPKLRKLFKKLGIATGYHFMLEKGYTDVTEMLFAAKYGLVLNYDSGDLSEIIENNNALSLAYMVSNNVYNYKSNGNPFENQEYLVSCITGTDYNLYKKADENNIRFSSRGISVKGNENGEFLLSDRFSYNKISDINFPAIFAKDEKYSGSSPVITFYVPYIEGFATYGYADVKDKEIIKGLPLFYGANQGKRNGNSVAYNDIVKGKNTEGAKNDTFNLSLNSKDKYEFKNIVFYYLDLNKVDEVYRDISKNKVIIYKFKSDYMQIKVDKSEDRSVMFTSIPYEKGWSAYVDGKEVNITPCLEGTFISLDLSDLYNGEHNVELRFVPPGIKTGLLISMVSFMLTIFYVSKSLKHRIYKGLQGINNKKCTKV